MKIWINNGSGFVDYTQYVLPETIQITDSINVPTLASFSLSNNNGAFRKPVRGGYVRIVSERIFDPITGDPLVLATGFVTNDPVMLYKGLSPQAGVDMGFQIYECKVNVTSDEWLLNVKTVPFIPAFVNQGVGQILKTLAEVLCPGFFDTTLVASGDLVPYYQYDPTKNWSDVVKSLADTNRYRYKVLDKKIYYQPFGDGPLGIIYDESRGESSFYPDEFNSGILSVPPVNDAVVIGDVEPNTIREDNFIGDGFTTNFPFHHKTFHAKSAVMLNEAWNQNDNQFQTNLWNVYEYGDKVLPGGTSIFSWVGALNAVNNGTGANEGDNAIVAVNGIELGGALDLEHGEFQFNDLTNGILGGIYQGFGAGGNGGLTTDKCIAGFKITSPYGSVNVNVTSSGASGIAIQAIYNGQSVGPVVLTKVNCSYVLQTVISNERYDRYVQIYRTMAGNQFGGYTVDAPAVVTFLVTEINIGEQIRVQEGLSQYSNVPIASLQSVVSKFVVTGANVPAFGVYSPVNIDNANLVVTNTSLNQTPQGTLMVRSLTDSMAVSGNLLNEPGATLVMGGMTGPSGGMLPIHPEDLGPEEHYLLGAGFQNQTATIGQGTGDVDQLQFYIDTIPPVGARIRIQTWEAQTAMGRVRDPQNIAESAVIVGDDGVRMAIFSTLTPLPRTSEECEMAAASAIRDRENTQYQGNYRCFSYFLSPSITGYPVPGRYLYAYAPYRGILGLNLFINTVTTTVEELRDEILHFDVQFGPDLYLEKLLHKFLERTDNILTPQESANPPDYVHIDELATSYIGDLTSAHCMGVSGTQVFIDLGVVPVTAAEIRRTNSGWGKTTRNLIGTITTQYATIPRRNYDETWYIRQKNGDLYSRHSKAIRVVAPRVPSAPGAKFDNSNTYLLPSLHTDGINPLKPTIMLDYGGNDIRNVYGGEIRDDDGTVILDAQRAIVAPQDLLFVIDNSIEKRRQRTFHPYFFNTMWEYSDEGPVLSMNVEAPSITGLTISGSGSVGTTSAVQGAPSVQSGVNWTIVGEGIKGVGSSNFAHYNDLDTLTWPMIGTAFGFAVPSNAIITGVSVQLVGFVTHPSGSVVGFFRGGEVSLVYQGSKIGTAKSPSGLFSALPGTQYNLGNSADTWGVVLTPAIVNDPSFGFSASVFVNDSGTNGNVNGYVMTVHYTIDPATVNGPWVSWNILKGQPTGYRVRVTYAGSNGAPAVTGSSTGVFADGFNRANGGIADGVNWIKFTNFADLVIDGGELENPTWSTDKGCYHPVSGVDLEDQQVELDINVPNSTEGVAVVTRADAAGLNFYFVRRRNTTFQCGIRQNGVYTVKYGFLPAGARLGLKSVGNVHTAIVDGVEVYSWVDDTHASGYPGIVMMSGMGNAPSTGDNFEYTTLTVSGATGSNFVDSADVFTIDNPHNPEGLLGFRLPAGDVYNDLIVVCVTPFDLLGDGPTECTSGAVQPSNDSIQSYKLTPSAPLSQAGGSFVISVSAFNAYFDKLTRTVYYNARSFTIPDPGAGNTVIYYVTIADPAVLGDVGDADLQTFYETDTSKVGVLGYTYVGSIYVTHDGGSNILVTPGGWPQQQTFLVQP